MYTTMHHSHNKNPYQLVYIFTLIKRTLTLSRCDKSCYQNIVFYLYLGR